MDEALLDLGRRFVNGGSPPGRVIMCAVTGSHLYGFTSPDSDLDLKGLFVAPTEEFLGLGQPREAFDRMSVFEDLECDLTLHEIGFGVRGLLKGNGNLLERVEGPWQLFRTPELDELRAMLPHLLSKRCHGHYSGFFRQVCRFFDREGTAKSLLYSVRVALTGIHLLRTGEVRAHLPTLAKIYGFTDDIEPIVAIKTEGAERIGVRPVAAAPLRRRWPELETLLEQARDRSPLPAEPPARHEAEAWLIALRRGELA